MRSELGTMTRVDTIAPTHFQLALAIVILESKPAESNVRDYIAVLRAQICRTTSTPPYSQEAYIDGINYWKLRCEQLAEERSQLLVELTELRVNNGIQCTVTAKRQQSNNRRKRKTPMPQEDACSGESSLKRSRGVELEPLTIAEIMPASIAMANDSKEPGKRLATLLLCMNRQLQVDPSSDTNLVFMTISACQQLSGIIHSACGQDENLNSAELLIPAGRALAAVFHTCGKLSCDAKEGDRKIRGAIVHATVSVAETVLNAISANCLQRALLEQNPGQLPKIESERLKAAIEVPRLLTNLLLAYINIETLVPSKTLHRSIFEGLAYLILQHTSTCLAILVHGRNTDDAGTPIPVIKEVGEQVERVAFIHKAIHLGSLVDRVATLAPKYLSPPDGPKLTRSKTVNSKTATDRRTEGGLLDMHPLVKTKLQKTLTSFMSSSNEEHDEFLDCLQKPRRVLLKEPSRTAKAEKQRMKDAPVEWFVEKTWSAVGWDILRQEQD